MRPAETPRLTRYSFTALARRAPSARLYSRVPRSSQWPSTVTRTRRIFLQPGGLAPQRRLVGVLDVVLVVAEMDRVADIDAQVFGAAGHDARR